MAGLVPIVVAALCALAGAGCAPVLGRWIEADSRWRSRWPVAVLAAAGGAGAAVVAAGPAELVGLALLSVSCALLVVVDLACSRLPDPLVALSLGVLVAALTLAAALHGQWTRFAVAMLTGLVIMVGYFVLAWIRPDDLGLGDVKLAGVLGVVLGWYGWSQTVLGVLGGFALAALAAVLLLATRRVTRRDSFPLGPCLVLGTALGVALGPTLLG